MQDNPVNPDYYKVKLELLIGELSQATASFLDDEEFRMKVRFILKKHHDTLIRSQDPSSTSIVPEWIH